MSALKELILEKEHSLLNHEARCSLSHIAATLCDEFVEFGSSGRVHMREDVLKWLQKEPPFDYEISNFNLEQLSRTVVLATYAFVSNGSRSWRSSIWVLRDNQWQMRFHQGTRYSKKRENKC